MWNREAAAVAGRWDQAGRQAGSCDAAALELVGSALSGGQAIGGGVMESQLARCKIVVVGDSQCGKTALLHVFAKDAYPEVGETRAAGVGRRRRLLAGESGRRWEGARRCGRRKEGRRWPGRNAGERDSRGPAATWVWEGHAMDRHADESGGRRECSGGRLPGAQSSRGVE